MKAEATIRGELGKLRTRNRLLEPHDRAVDQSYGAIEALRWVLGEGPRPRELGRPLQVVRCAECFKEVKG